MTELHEVKNIEEIFHWLRKYRKQFSKAKSDRVFLEHFRKSKLAILHESRRVELEGIRKVTESELDNYARSHPEYIELLEGLRAATEIEEELGLIIKAIWMRSEMWRTEQANDRAERKGYLA